MMTIDSYGNFYYLVYTIPYAENQRTIYAGNCIGFTNAGLILFLPELFFDEDDLRILQNDIS